MNLLSHNWNLKLMALALAVVLWGHVRSTVNPWETATFLVRLRSSAPPRMVFVDGSKVPDTVKVTVGGPRLSLRQIKGVALANPLSPTGDVISLTSGQVRAALDFSLARKGRQDVPVKAEATVEDVEVIGVNPSNVVVVLDPAASRELTLRPQFLSNLPRGFHLEKVIAQPERASVSGPSEALARVASLRAQAKPQNLKADVPRTLQATVVALDARGRIVLGVVVEPPTASISATLREERIKRRVRVTVKIKGSLAPGYRIVEVDVTPARLSLSGPRHAFENVAALSVPLDVNGIKTTLHKRVSVALPANLTSAGRARVSVRVRVAPLEAPPPTLPTAAASTPVSDADEATLDAMPPNGSTAGGEAKPLAARGGPLLPAPTPPRTRQ